MEQITLNFEAGLVKAYPTMRDYVSFLVHHQGKPQKAVAADMDLSSSDLSRKLSPNDDHRKFTICDLEAFIDTTGDTSPVLYLVEKYLSKADPERIAALEAEIERLKRKRAA